MNIYWIGFKLLDKSTNHSMETEMIKNIVSESNEIRYFCGYKNQKKYFGLNKELLHYFYSPSVPKIRTIFFVIGIFITLVKGMLVIRPDAIIIDYLINLMFSPLLLIGKLINRKTKITLDIRTIPVNIEGFRRSIKVFYASLFMAKFTTEGITFISPFMRDYCLKHVNLRNKKISIWSSGFNEEMFNPNKYQQTRKKETFKIFYHGGISLSRGIDNLIQAIGLLRDKKYKIHLSLIGNILDEKEIKKIIFKNKLENLCEIFPPVPYEKIPRIIMDIDLPVIPLPDFIGWRVSCPLKLIEYMAMGKSIVLTDIEAHRGVVNGCEFAFYSRSSSAEDLAEAIEKAYKRRDYLDKLGKEGRKIALGQYTWRQQANKLIAFISSL